MYRHASLTAIDEINLTMPSSTSKIPLPLGAVTSPSRSIGSPQEVPQQSRSVVYRKSASKVIVPTGRIPTVKGVRSPVGELPYRQQQGKEAFSGNHTKEALNPNLNPAQAREQYSPARESVSPNRETEGSSKIFNNPTNLKESLSSNNAKKDSFVSSNMGEGSPGNSQVVNKENIGGKKSRIPDIR